MQCNTYICTHLHITYIHTYIHTYVHTYVHSYVHANTYIHTYMNGYRPTDVRYILVGRTTSVVAAGSVKPYTPPNCSKLGPSITSNVWQITHLFRKHILITVGTLHLPSVFSPRICYSDIFVGSDHLSAYLTRFLV